MNDFMHEQPDPNPSETRTLQDFTKIELQGVIVDAAEHLSAAIQDGDEQQQAIAFQQLSDAVQVIHSKFPTYGPDPSDGKIGARSDLDIIPRTDEN